VLKSSFLSSQFKRAGDILRRGASDQIADYTRRFDSIKSIYDGFLKDLIKKGFSSEDAAATARVFFGSERVSFAAVDGTEYTRPMFDLVIFFGGSYASKGFVEFRDDGPRVEYSTRFVEEGMGVSSCVPMYVNEIVNVEQAYMELGEGGNLTVDRPLTDEAVINNSTIANWIMTFSEFYLAYKLAKQGDVKILLLDRSLCTMHGSLIYDTRRGRLWNTCAILDCDAGGVKVDENDIAYNRHNPDIKVVEAKYDDKPVLFAVGTSKQRELSVSGEGGTEKVGAKYKTQKELDWQILYNPKTLPDFIPIEKAKDLMSGTVAVTSGSAAVYSKQTEFKEISPEELKQLITLNYDKTIENVIYKLHGSVVSTEKKKREENQQDKEKSS
jgi:hypothetical protein